MSAWLNGTGIETTLMILKCSVFPTFNISWCLPFDWCIPCFYPYFSGVEEGGGGQ